MYRPLHVKNKLEIMPKNATKKYFQWLCYQASRYSIDVKYAINAKGPFVTYKDHNYYIYTPAASTIRSLILKEIWRIRTRNQEIVKYDVISNMSLIDIIHKKFTIISELIHKENNPNVIKKIIKKQLGDF